MNKLVLNTTNEKDLYAFFMPLTAMLWNKIIGYSPISLFIGSEETWSQPKNKFILEETQKYARVFVVPVMPGLESSTMAQVSRLYASALPDLQPEDYLLTSDVDMFPLNKSRFHSQDLVKDFHIFNADAYSKEEQRFPMCYLGAKVKIWRQVMSISTLNIVGAMEEGFQQYPITQPWNHDELTFYQALSKSSIWPAQCQLLPRVTTGPNFGRVDRGGWRFQGLKGMVDGHLVRPGFTKENWSKIYQLLKQLCQQPELDFATNYMECYGTY